MKILLVDNHPDFVQVVIDSLSDHEVAVAASLVVSQDSIDALRPATRSR